MGGFAYMRLISLFLCGMVAYVQHFYAQAIHAQHSCVQHLRAQHVHVQDLINLEEGIQDFVLETKQIIIPEFPGAFNPAIVRWRGGILMSFRTRDAAMVSNFGIGLVWLDNNFNPVSKPQILEVQEEYPSAARRQDPRFIVVDQQLYMVYSNFVQVEKEKTRRVFVAQVQYEQGRFFAKNVVCLHPFEGWSKRWEKNWVPFDYHGTMLLAYSLLPHRILEPEKSGACATKSVTVSDIDWSWGELRGGTPAILEEEYIAFFHSSKNMATTYSNGEKMQHYVMGAYTFSAQPPFAITRISPEPIVAENFYNGKEYNTWKPLRVVFPMGLIADEDYFWVSYGRQDHEMWIAKLDKKKLYASLAPVSLKRRRVRQILSTKNLFRPR